MSLDLRETEPPSPPNIPYRVGREFFLAGHFQYTPRCQMKKLRDNILVDEGFKGWDFRLRVYSLYLRQKIASITVGQLVPAHVTGAQLRARRVGRGLGLGTCESSHLRPTPVGLLRTSGRVLSGAWWARNSGSIVHGRTGLPKLGKMNLGRKRPMACSKLPGRGGEAIFSLERNHASKSLG